MYKVKKEDLIGKIEGLPIEIVQKMIEHQFAQTGKCDITVFQKLKSASKGLEGFNWILPPEGEDFWGQVIVSKNFDLFFEKYPKNQLDLRDLVSKWAEEKEKYLAISHTLKTIFENLDAKIQDHWPISLKELKALNEGLSNILLEDIFNEVVKLNS